MKPILILQNLTPDGPGYLATWLRRHGVPFEVFDTEAGHAYPARIEGYSGLAVLGGEMSANDPLPSLRQSERLILEAMASERPVIGHCLGGQLMARALGAPVGASAAPEIGWQRMQVLATPMAHAWFGDAAEQTVYHWHSETFGLPPGAELLASSPACAHQAFVIGKHLAMQFHVELDAAKLAVWSASTDPAFLRMQRECASVQDGARMRVQAFDALPEQHRLADRIYTRWLGSVT